MPVSEKGTYDIYRSNTPITDPGKAVWVGRVFAGNGANARLSDLLEGYRWKLPDGSGGSLEVGEDEAYFVYTPHETGLSYYAVLYMVSSILDSLPRICRSFHHLIDEDTTRAIHYFEECLRLDPNITPAREWLQRLKPPP